MLDRTAGCRQTLWEICTGLWNRLAWLPQLTTGQPAALNTSAHLCAESTTLCSMTNSTGSGSSIVPSRCVVLCFDDIWPMGFWWSVNVPVFIFGSLQNVPLQDTNRSMGFLGWRWVNGLKIFPLPVPHRANIFPLEITGTWSLYFSSLLSALFSFYSSFHSAQKHKDSVSLESGETFRRRQNRRLVWWINEFMHFVMTWLGALNWMHVRPPSLASVGFISAGVAFGHYVWFAGGIEHYFGCTRHFVVHVCVRVCAI